MDSEKEIATSDEPQCSCSSLEGETGQGSLENQEEVGSWVEDNVSTRSGQFQKARKKGLFVFLFIAFVTFLVVDSIYFCIIPDALSGFLEWIEDNPVPGIFSFTLVFFVATVLLVPGALLTLGAGYVFANAFGLGLGVVLGTLSTFVGACAGSMVSFLLGRYLLRDCVKKLSQKYEICEALNVAMNEKGFRIMVLLRLSPVIPFNIINYIAGVTGITLLYYTISLLALLPGTVLYVFLGASAGSLANTSQSGSENAAVTTWVIVISVAMGILAIALTSYYAKKELNKIAANKRRLAQRPESLTQTSHLDDESSHGENGAVLEGMNEKEKCEEKE
eukprot:scaffold2499_cov125-Cylindrotheca_fusiformis.AAC.17